MLRTASTIGLFCLALATVGCSGTSDLLSSETYAGAFSKPIVDFKAPVWASRNTNEIQLGPTGPVGPEDLVAADGRCGPEAAAVAQAAAPQPPAQDQAAAAPAAPAPPAAPADRPVGGMAGDLASEPMPAGPAAPAATTGAAPAAPPDRLEPAGGFGMPMAPAVTGGVALGMSECQVVRRAGTPNNVSVGADNKGERTVVLSYLGGSWPGIYHFESGRLKEVDAAPTPPKPAKPVKKNVKKKKPVKQKQAQHEIERIYVQ